MKKLRSIIEVVRERTQDYRPNFAVGDIHGHDKAAKTAILFLEKMEGLVVFLGDYVDRGPSSLRTLDLLADSKRQHPDWFFLLGNHEDMLIKMLSDGIEETIANHPVETWPSPVILECRDQGGLPIKQLDFVNDLALFHEAESFLYVHAGIGPDHAIPLDQQDLIVLTKRGTTCSRWQGKRIVHGHIVVEEPKCEDTHINIDTSCYSSGWLSIGILNNKTGNLDGCVQVSADGTELRIHKPLESGW